MSKVGNYLTQHPILEPLCPINQHHPIQSRHRCHQKRKMQRQLFEHRRELSVGHKALKSSSHNRGGPQVNGSASEIHGLLSKQKISTNEHCFHSYRSLTRHRQQSKHVTSSIPFFPDTEAQQLQGRTCYSIKTAPGAHSRTTCQKSRNLNLSDCDQEQDSGIKVWLLCWRGWSHLWNQSPLYKPHLRLYSTGL